jgi:hypothetical protein
MANIEEPPISDPVANVARRVTTQGRGCDTGSNLTTPFERLYIVGNNLNDRSAFRLLWHRTTRRRASQWSFLKRGKGLTASSDRPHGRPGIAGAPAIATKVLATTFPWCECAGVVLSSVSVEMLRSFLMCSRSSGVSRW